MDKTEKIKKFVKFCITETKENIQKNWKKFENATNDEQQIILKRYNNSRGQLFAFELIIEFIEMLERHQK